jgi:hypothetical protein
MNYRRLHRTTLRILDVLSRKPGGVASIKELVRRVETIYGSGSAYYANLYRKLQRLSDQGIVSLSERGRARRVSLNFRNPMLVDVLAEMELEKKIELLEDRRRLQPVYVEIARSMMKSGSVASVCAVDPEENARLNRMELLILTRSGDVGESFEEVLTDVQQLTNVRIDALTLSEDEFIDLAMADERNPVREMLWDKICFLWPQTFWFNIREAIRRGIQIRVDEEEIRPSRIDERDLAYNLVRFGYEEIGVRFERGEDICVEYVVTSILLGGDARRVMAIPVVLAKMHAHPNLLFFLARKYGVSDRLLGILQAMRRFREVGHVEAAIEKLEMAGVHEVGADERAIGEVMRLYNVG